MEMVASSLCTAVANLGKKSDEEIMSPDVDIVKSPGGHSERTRQTLKKKMTKGISAPISAIADIIQSTVDVGKDLVQIIKDIV